MSCDETDAGVAVCDRRLLLALTADTNARPVAERTYQNLSGASETAGDSPAIARAKANVDHGAGSRDAVAGAPPRGLRCRGRCSRCAHCCSRQPAGQPAIRAGSRPGSRSRAPRADSW
eukprot:310664-Chlamydomonas_euryale.AAC.4